MPVQILVYRSTDFTVYNYNQTRTKKSNILIFILNFILSNSQATQATNYVSYSSFFVFNCFLPIIALLVIKKIFIFSSQSFQPFKCDESSFIAGSYATTSLKLSFRCIRSIVSAIIVATDT